MNDLWARVGKVWNSYKPPLRPTTAVAAEMARMVRADDADVILLGVTPEFARVGRTLRAIDVAPAMVGAIWPGDTAAHKAEIGNWLQMPAADSSIDAVLGDGVFPPVGGQEARLGLLANIARVLRPDGRAAFRLFARPEHETSLDDIVADALAGRIANTSELAMRVFYAMPRPAPDYVLGYRDVFDAVEAMFPDRGPMMRACGLVAEDFAFIDLYKNSETISSWVPAALSVEEASRHFGEVRLVATSGYPQAAQCPIMYVEKPRKA